jgi:hypothetical protein
VCSVVVYLIYGACGRFGSPYGVALASTALVSRCISACCPDFRRQTVTPRVKQPRGLTNTAFACNYAREICRHFFL